MRKSIFLSFVFSLLFFAGNAQTTAANTDSPKKCNIEECAKKMGVSVEECKKICSLAKGEASSDTKVAASLVSLSEEGAVSSKKACSKACSKVCSKKADGSKSMTKVASAVVELDDNGEPIAKKKCDKSKKSCKSSK